MRDMPVGFPDEEEFNTGVGWRINMARRKAGMTQGELAKRLGVSANTVSRWETGTYKVPFYDILRIGAMFNISISWFIAIRSEV